LLLAAPALGQTPAPSPATDKPMPAAVVNVPDGPLYAGDLVVLDGSSSIGDSLDWELLYPADVTTFVIDSNGKTIAFANSNPGTYIFRLEAESIVGGSIVRAKKRVAIVTVSKTPQPPTPPPGPGPTPPPTPPPTPAPVTLTRPAFVTLVVDSSTMASITPSLAAIRDSTTLPAKITAANARWLTLDVPSPEFARRNLANAVAAAGGAPCIIIQGSPTSPGGPAPVIAKFPVADMSEDQLVAKINSIIGGA
jgi:hypothetical protein